MIDAKIIEPDKPGLCLLLTLTEDDEARFRSMMDVINDYGASFKEGPEAGLAKAIDHLFRISEDAVRLIEQHKSRLY